MGRGELRQVSPRKMDVSLNLPLPLFLSSLSIFTKYVPSQTVPNMASNSTMKKQLLAVLTLGGATQYICYYFHLGVAIHVCNLVTSGAAAMGVARYQRSDGPYVEEKIGMPESIHDGASKL
jgi:hypothetical protein